MEAQTEREEPTPVQEDPVVWKKAVNRVVPCVVVLKVTLSRAVDTEPASSAYATGFIVDKARGIILTNRHVLTPGPIVAEAIFLNREELPVYPLYYDPVHDFGFLRFDPSKLQFMEVQEVPLAPETASVGLDIRVVGNDSGEKVSILAGVLARVDRDAPAYGRKSYNDFNTFYLQAASGTKGGSSGSPVIDCQGRAVGLNAGGKNKAASAYYLPLDRVVRALKLIQGQKPIGSPALQWSAPAIPRGDLQTTFTFKGFDEVRRLGLQQETERAVRAAPGRTHGTADAEALVSTGMLVVECVLPGGPADGVLEAGDVLVRVNGQVVTHFLHLEELMDDAVGQAVTIAWERQGKPMEAAILVKDLHAVTPVSFLEVSGGTVHALSYQQARNNRVVTGQVYVAEPGYMLGRAAIPKHAIITQLNNTPTPDLESFARVLRALPHRARVPVEFYTFSDRHRRKSTIMHMDHQWYGPPVYWVRDDAAGCWHATTDWPPGSDDPPAQLPIANGVANGHGNGVANGAVAENGHPEVGLANGHASMEEDTADVQIGSNGVKSEFKGVTTPRSTRAQSGKTGTASASKLGMANGHAASSKKAADKQALSAEQLTIQLEEVLRCSMVLVDVDIPLVALSDGVHARSFAGNGLVVHHSEKLGMVLVDRNTVTIGPCDVTLSFGAHPSEIPGTARFLHPLHNFALISYDPQALPVEARAKVRAATLLPDPPIRRGDTVYLAGLTKFLRIMHRKSIVTTATSAHTVAAPEVPRFRAVHEELVKLDQDFGATFSGVLTDESGRVRALWGSYSEQEWDEEDSDFEVDKEEREWCSGLPAHVFYPWVQRLLAIEAAAQDGVPQAITKAPPTVRTLDAELEPLMLSKAAQFSLPSEWVVRLDQLDPERRQVLRVRSTVANSHAAQLLKSGDMLLAIAGKPVTCFHDVETIIAAYNDGHVHSNDCNAIVPNGKATGRGKRKAAGSAADSMHARKRGCGRQADSAAAADTGHSLVSTATAQDCNSTAEGVGSCTDASEHNDSQAAAEGEDKTAAQPRVPVTVFRSGQILELEIQLGKEDGMATHRLVHWCGAQLQAPHRAVRELGWLPDCHGVYISRWHHGSPAHRYGLYALHWILEVNGKPTPDLDTFLQVVQPLQHGDFVRVKVCHLETAQIKVLTLKMDLAYWPTWELRLQPETCMWQRLCIDASAA